MPPRRGPDADPFMEDSHLPMTKAHVMPELKECVRAVQALMVQHQSGG